MNNKLDLECLNEVRSPASLDEKVFKQAKRKMVPKKRVFSKFYASIATAYCFGLVSFVTFDYALLPVITPTTNNHLEISLKPLTFRSNNAEKIKVVDVATLSHAQRRDLAIELLMRDDLIQAQKLLTWMDENQEK
jgi:hypothetical protein